MPTPESAAYQAKKPTVPPTYDGVDFEDNVAVHNARDAIIREQWVRSMMSRLVGEELGKCYAREGVNHLEKCGVLRGEFGHLFRFFVSFVVLCGVGLGWCVWWNYPVSHILWLLRVLDGVVVANLFPQKNTSSCSVSAR